MPNRSRQSALSHILTALVLASAVLPSMARGQGATESPAQAAARMRALGNNPDSVFFAYQVQQTVRPTSAGRAPVYPAALKAAGTEGDVLLSFVVDTTGHVAPSSVRVLRSSHGLFTDAARVVVDSMSFAPARLNGRAVSQVVQQPFQFRLPH